MSVRGSKGKRVWGDGGWGRETQTDATTFPGLPSVRPCLGGQGLRNDTRSKTKGA